MVYECAAVEEALSKIADRRSTLPFVFARYGRQARGRNPQCVAKRRNSLFSASAPSQNRSSPIATALIWSNNSPYGTPPKASNALSRHL
jgi:hypothetical protein